MAKAEFTFKGKTMSELNSMELADFANLLDTRHKRSLLRGIDKPFMKRIEKAIKNKEVVGHQKKPVKTHGRDAIIVPKMVGLLLGVYNGKEFVIVQVSEKMLGHYLGEMALTRKRLVHGKAGIGATRSSTAITARG
ncbi:MAG: 30S ribosomal protein S19 [Candidatus Diapherotrites archaeon]